MNASSPPSSLAPTEIAAPETRPGEHSTAKRRRDWGWMRPVASCGGALLVGALLVRLAPPPVARPSAPLSITQSDGAPLVLSASQLVQARLVPTKMSARMLSGGWKLSTDALGHAGVAGEVARWAVEPGAHVEAGDKVVEISTGGVSRPIPVVESTRQNRAEREQVQAHSGQEELSQSLAIARTQLAAAQERVSAAQEKVASTRALVQRLLNGEKIPVAGETPPRKRHLKRVRHTTLDDTGASGDGGRAQADAQRAKSGAQSAQSESEDAKSALAAAQTAVKTSSAALAKAETDFEAEKITADVLQSARDAADDAASTLKAAQTRADVAGRTAASRASKADAAEEEARRAHVAAAKTREAAPPAPIKSDEPEAGDGGRYMTADQAAPLVAAALRESKTAIRQAERVHARVNEYERQVKQTSQNVVAASQDLQSAQENVLQSVPRAVFSSERAPVAGTITWISRLAREVSVGQPIFGISRGGSGFLRFSDESGAWKLLKVGQTLRAASGSAGDAPPDAAQSTTKTGDTTTTSSPAMPPSQPSGAPVAPIAASTPLPDAAPMPTFSVRITHITPPTREGGAAVIDAASLDTAPPSGAQTVQAELPLDVLPVIAASAPTGEKSVVVPASVVLPRDGASFVAVVESPTGQASKPLSLTWRAVRIERETAFDVEIKSGLRDGERVVDQPILLLSQIKPEEKKILPVVVQTTS